MLNLFYFIYGAGQTYFLDLLPSNPTDISFIIMPCVVQPGGISGRMQVCYTTKLALLAMAKHLQEEEGFTLRSAAKHLGFAQSLFSTWMSRQGAVIDPTADMINRKKKAFSPGPLGQLKPIEDALLRYIFKKCMSRGYLSPHCPLF